MHCIAHVSADSMYSAFSCVLIVHRDASEYCVFAPRNVDIVLGELRHYSKINPYAVMRIGGAKFFYSFSARGTAAFNSTYDD
ncbi:hypothetical protein GJV44_00347 [Candidatus Vallotia cooleyia]|nr:hypothetical protein GJV44_00347 [Candidatus Vallotia cooleyia]